MEPGTVFADKYLVTRVLSTGALGTVCEATHELMGRRVVIKLIRARALASVGDQGAWKVRFRREVRAASGIASDHVVGVIDAGTDGRTGTPFIVMEYLEGEDGSETIRRLGCLPVLVALKVVAQACKGVQAAHELGVLHRDIKPGNLFLSEMEDERVVVKLLDFGLAKAMRGEAGLLSHNDITEPGGVLGTPSYMSPEQARGEREIDERADVWSLGAVLHGLLCGSGPYARTAVGPADVMLELCVGKRDPPPIQRVAPWIPPEVAAVVCRALRRDRSRRYSSVRAMGEAIGNLLPDGEDLVRQDIVSLPRSERAIIAPPLVLGEECPLGPQPTEPSAPSERPVVPLHGSAPNAHRGRWLALLLLALVVFGALWMVMPRAHQDPTPARTQESLPLDSKMPSAIATATLMEGGISPSDASRLQPPSHRRPPTPTASAPKPLWTPPITDPGF